MTDDACFAGATVIEGDVAQSEERLVCNQEVAGSNPVISTDQSRRPGRFSGCRSSNVFARSAAGSIRQHPLLERSFGGARAGVACGDNRAMTRPVTRVVVSCAVTALLAGCGGGPERSAPPAARPDRGVPFTDADAVPEPEGGGPGRDLGNAPRQRSDRVYLGHEGRSPHRARPRERVLADRGTVLLHRAGHRGAGRSQA
jgi:hypothetical protein